MESEPQMNPKQIDLVVDKCPNDSGRGHKIVKCSCCNTVWRVVQ